MNTNGQTFRNHISTSTARLGGISRVHGDDLGTSFFRFVFEHLSEQAKPSIMRGQRQVSVSVHKAERKVFYCYPVMLGNQPATDLVEIIQPLVGNMLMQPGDLQVCFLLPVTAFRLAASGDSQSTPPWREPQGFSSQHLCQPVCRFGCTSSQGQAIPA